jgi:four helix bundle protein
MQGRLSQEFRDRTKRCAAGIIRFYVGLPKNREEVRVIGKQLLRSGTSIAAQVREPARARSKSEFNSKLGGAVQEADESLLWLELLREECDINAHSTSLLEGEMSELIAIMTTMIRRTGDGN